MSSHTTPRPIRGSASLFFNRDPGTLEAPRTGRVAGWSVGRGRRLNNEEVLTGRQRNGVYPVHYARKMADPAKFGHDGLGHLLGDNLLVVPEFQRRFSWDAENVDEYWSDILKAFKAGASYFMGTVVLASTENDSRYIVVDGQQRITTTAVLFAAIRDRLAEFGQTDPSRSVDSRLSNYVLEEEARVAKLTLSPFDDQAYANILAGAPSPSKSDGLSAAYHSLKARIDAITPTPDSYRELITLVGYLDKKVQVLLATATGMSEAYTIFETLNDRGAALTTADLLKNYLFSAAGAEGLPYAQTSWGLMQAKFEKPEDFVKFLRYEFMSRNGHVTQRQLYRSLQAEIQESAARVRSYLSTAQKSLKTYTAIKEPDDISWSAQSVEVKDSLLAFRRFGFEASMPLLLAAFANWDHTTATRFVDTVAAWSVRAWAKGSLGGGVAEETFCVAAQSIADGTAQSANDLRDQMSALVPDDASFKEAISNYGGLTTTRAKYLLAQLERVRLEELGKSSEAMPDWSSKSVSVEHIFAKSSGPDAFDSEPDFEKFTLNRDRLGNLTLLERTLNNDLEDKPFSNKIDVYSESKFEQTKDLAQLENGWDLDELDRRSLELARLAVVAWPL